MGHGEYKQRLITEELSVQAQDDTSAPQEHKHTSQSINYWSLR